MSERPSMKAALKTMGEGQFEVVLDRADFNVSTFTLPDGKQTAVPGPSLIAFTATSCRDIGDDVWEFRVPVQTQGGGMASSLLYARGVDVYMLKQLSKVV